MTCELRLACHIFGHGNNLPVASFRLQIISKVSGADCAVRKRMEGDHTFAFCHDVGP